MANLIEKAKKAYVEQVKISKGATLEQLDFATLEEQTDVFIQIENKMREVKEELRKRRIPEHEHEFVDGVCSICGYEDPDYIPLHEHEFVDGVCTICGYEDPDYIPPHDHEFFEGVCVICGEKDPDYIPPHEHEFVDGICSICGYTDPNYKVVNEKVKEMFKYENVIFDEEFNIINMFKEMKKSCKEDTNLFIIECSDFVFVKELNEFSKESCFISRNKLRVNIAKELGYDALEITEFMMKFIDEF